MVKRALMIAILAALPWAERLEAADDAAIRQAILQAFRAVVEQGDLAEVTKDFSDCVHLELREGGWVSTSARGRKAVERAIQENRPSGKLLTTEKMIHVAVAGAEAVAVADFEFTDADGEPFGAVFLLQFAKADGAWRVTRIVMCDNAPAR